MKTDRFLRRKLWIGLVLLAAAVWTGAALGGVLAGDSTTTAPANDNFADAFVLPSLLQTSRPGDTNVDATLEVGEPTDVEGSPGGASVWYRWTAPQDGQVTIDTATSDFDTLLGVYTGSAVNALSIVAENDDAPGGGTTSLVKFNVTVGTTYQIKVDGYAPETGTINLHLNEVLPPPNDDLTDATLLTALPVTRSGDTNVAATHEPGEDPNGSASVWYSWTAPLSGPVTIDTETSSFDTLLDVYTGASFPLVGVASNDDRSGGLCDNLTSAVTFTATASTVYRIRVDGYGENVGTINLRFASGTAIVPCAPINVAATPGAGQAIVSWGEPLDDGGSPITGYEVTRYVGGVAQGTTHFGSSPATVSGLTNGTTYTFRVAATNTAGTGPQSTDSNAVTPTATATVPGAPTLTAATAGNASVALAWSAPGSDGGSPIISYTATASPGGATCTSSGLGCTVSGLTNGASYSFTVTATNAVGPGPASNALVATPAAAATVPGAPATPSASAGNGQATVSWSAPASDGGSAITGYDVTRYVAGVAQGTTTVGGVTQATVGGLANGTTYTFRVAATNGVGTGAQSPDSNAVTPAAPRFTLTVAKSGSGSGTVTSSVGGINCGTACATDFAEGTSVTLTATAASGSTFAGWSGACTGLASCTLTIDASKSATATFALQAVTSPPKVVKCVVPKVTRKPLATAKRKIAAAHCRTGKITKAKSKTVPKGSVISQSPKAGKRLARGSKVNLVVSRGKH